MRRHPKDALERWWTAESGGREAEAERALFSLFRVLPEPVPSPDFADRVVAAWTTGREELRAPGFRPTWRIRLAIALCLFLAGLAAAFLLPTVLGMSRFVTPSEVIASVAAGFSTLVQSFAGVVSLWGFLAHLRDSLLLVVTAPPVIASLLMGATLAALAFRGLIELLHPARSSAHAYA